MDHPSFARRALRAVPLFTAMCLAACLAHAAPDPYSSTLPSPPVASHDDADVPVDTSFDTRPPAMVLKAAIAMIDTEDLGVQKQAKVLLERLLRRDPKQPQAYLELARIAMKTNWGPQGLREAEALIRSALQVQPGFQNATILLGYVHANQGRHREAEALYKEAARTPTTNLWLWTNWGELLASQGREPEAIAMYRKALVGGPTRDANDRARQHAYDRLLAIHRGRSDLDAAEPLLRQRVADYPDGPCTSLSLARFLVAQRGDAAGAEAVLRTMKPVHCEQGEGRMIMALVRYMDWSTAPGPRRAEALRMARVEMPVGPRLFQLLAETDRTIEVARQLVRAGEDISAQDNRQMDALAYALAEHDAGAARRLLAAGARADALVGPEKMPLALLPVLVGDPAGIEVMKRAGVDYRQLRFRGMTAAEIARDAGDAAVQKALATGPSRI
ncbi:tetratricopeptide repeat protein [Ramlibacter algicola]|uniref:Tetratricopeptide repeat protein n=1 Tax=Ramlibacter algicola TaxID=2795217 RepID=A0A934UQI7_9BURK|nr:tetratricopeptide repeat protein [Ramlibacter algicola]MBK0391856.1 tetratricopeptide repeat protein [Ramlibacter algicola]